MPIPVSNSGHKENFLAPYGTTTVTSLVSMQSDDEKRLYEEKNIGRAQPNLFPHEKPDLTMISLATNLCETAPINNDNDGNVLDNEIRQPLSRPDDHSEESDDNTTNSDEQCLLPQN